MMNFRLNRSACFYLVFALGASLAACGKPAESAVAYVSNQNGAVTVIDLATMETKGSLDIGATSPRGIGITADGKLLVTANRGEGNISVVDTASGKVVKHIVIGKNPEFVRVMGDRVYISYEPSSKGGPPPKPGAEPVAHEEDDDAEEKTPARIAVVDLQQGKVIQEIVGGPETEGIEFSKDGKTLIITNEADNTITVHDMATGALLKTIPTSEYGDRPRGIKASPDGSYYLATLEFGDSILMLDSEFNPVRTISTAKYPYGISFDRAGKRIFVAAARDKLLQVFDAKTFEKIKDISTGDRCWHFSFTPDDSQLLLACGKSDEVLVIDASTLEVTKRIGNKAMPWGIVTYPKSVGSLDVP